MTEPIGDSALVLASIILSIGSLVFTLLLFVSYFSKRKVHGLRTRLYKGMLSVTTFLIISEIFQALSIAYFDNPILIFLTYKIHWSSGVIWFSSLYFYSIVFMDTIEVDTYKELINYNKTTKFMAFLFLVMFIIYCFLPFDLSGAHKPYMSYFPGIASYFIYAFCAFAETMIVIHSIRNRERIDFRKRMAVIIMAIELVTIFAFQLIFRGIAFLPIGAGIQMFFLYFNIENPDLIMIKELEEVNNNINKSSKAKSDFLSNMSHEIRTPMNAIVGFSESLLNTRKIRQDVVKSDIKHISNAGNNLLEIVNNILDISKIESGNDTLDMKEYSLGNVVTELSSIINARIGDKKVDLIIDFDKSIPSRLYGDSTKLFQILLNLLTNAIKYTEVGKVVLSIKGEPRLGHENLKIKVSDTGYGIKKEDFDKLFEKFSRLESATQNEIEGTGLGLVITKRYVELMGGKIWFESEYKVGTTFYVEIAQKIVDKTEIGNIEEVKNEEKDQEYLDCSGYSILLVDDNELNLKVASRILSKYNFNIETVNNAKDCIDNVKMEKHYDMIFLDHMMPEIDGIECLHILKKLDGYTLPPIVALTANAITGMKEMYLNEGFDEYLSKPINLMELNKLIMKYFSKE